MKNGIVKIWVCTECEKEYLERPLVCSKCKKFEFEVKYGGQIHDAEELTKLVYAYRDDGYNKDIYRKDISKKTAPKDETPKDGDDVDKIKRTKL